MKLIIDPDEWFKINQTETTNTYKNNQGTILFEDCDEFNCIYSYWDITIKTGQSIWEALIKLIPE